MFARPREWGERDDELATLMAEIRHHIADEEGQMFAHMPEDPQQLLEPENQRSTPWGAQEITAAVDAVAREQLLLSPEGRSNASRIAATRSLPSSASPRTFRSEPRGSADRMPRPTRPVVTRPARARRRLR